MLILNAKLLHKKFSSKSKSLTVKLFMFHIFNTLRKGEGLISAHKCKKFDGKVKIGSQVCL